MDTYGIILLLCVRQDKQSSLNLIQSFQSKGTTSIVKLLAIADPEQKLPIIFDMLFPNEWLETKAEGDADGRTNREVQRVVSKLGLLYTL